MRSNDLNSCFKMPRIRASFRIRSSERVENFDIPAAIVSKIFPSFMALSSKTDVLATFLLCVKLFTALCTGEFGLLALVVFVRFESGFDSIKLLSDIARRAVTLACGDTFSTCFGFGTFLDVENIWHISWKLYTSSFGISAVTLRPGEHKSCTNIVHFCQFKGCTFIPSRKLKQKIFF